MKKNTLPEVHPREMSGTQDEKEDKMSQRGKPHAIWRPKNQSGFGLLENWEPVEQRLQNSEGKLYSARIV